MRTTDTSLRLQEGDRLTRPRVGRLGILVAVCAGWMAVASVANAQSDPATPSPQPSPGAQPAPAAPAPTPAPAAPAPAAPAPTTTAEQPKLPAKPAETAGMPATVIDGQQIESLLGKNVESSAGEDMGRIVDVLAEKSGQTRAAIIDFGGFFGVGSRKIAVDWHSLHFLNDGKADKVIIDLPRNQLRVAPVYKEGEPVVILGPGMGSANAGNGTQTPAAVAAPGAAAPAPAAPAPAAPAQPAATAKP